MGSGTSKPKLLLSSGSKDGGASTANGATSASSNNNATRHGSSDSASSRKSEDKIGHVAFQNGSYMGAPLPPNEPERHGYLCKLGVLDTAPDPRFDSITQLATLVFKVPIALVSLVDKDRQWFKSVQGLATDHTDRKSSFCAWTLLPEHPEVLVVSDATQDARFRDNQLVTGPPDIRFYAGCPLVASNNLRLGSLCIIDREPRVFDAEQCMVLANLAQMVVRELEKDKVLEEQKAVSAALTQENTQLLRAMDVFTEGIVLCNVSQPEWPVEFINEAWEQLTGFSKAELGNGFWSFFKIDAPDPEAVQKAYRQAVLDCEPFELRVYFTTQRRQKRYLTLQMRCANTENMDSYMPLVGVPAFLPSEANEGGPTYYFATLTQGQVQDEGSVARNSTSGSSVTGSITNSCSREAFALLNNRTDPFEDVKLGQLLGRGSYGRVYRGRWNGAQVAVKILEFTQARTSSPGDDDRDSTGHRGGQREQMEALLSAQLSHPNVVHTYKHFTREMPVADKSMGGPSMMETWMVMEFCNKGSLGDAIDTGEFRRKDNMFETDFVALLATAKEVASALCYLHSCRIVHADLSSNNVLLASSDKDKRKFTAKVCDFGLSKVLEQEGAAAHTRTMGTITHMPPEMLSEGKASTAADVYAFGVIMWEMVMCQRPWTGLSHAQIIMAVSSGRQLQLGQGCPASLRKFVSKCLATKPADRPTFSQVLKDLDDLEEDLVGLSGDL